MIARSCFESDAWQKFNQIGHKTSAGSLLSQIGKVPSWGCLALLLLRIGKRSRKVGETFFTWMHSYNAIFIPGTWLNRICKNLVSQKWVSNSDGSVWQFCENIWPWLQKYLAAKVSIKLGRHRQCPLQYFQCHERLRF